MTEMAARLRSLRLTISLLFALAALSVLSTLAGPRLEKAAPSLQAAARLLGIVEPWRSPLFLVVAGALVVNVTLCTWRRCAGRLGTPKDRRDAVVWLDGAVHLSLVVLIAGGVGQALWGEVGTGYLFAGAPATTMYVEGSDSDLPLGFAVVLEERRESHYPLRVKIGVRDAASGAKVALLEVVEGREAAIPGGGLSLSVQQVIDDPPAVSLLARTPAGEREVTLPLVDGADALRVDSFLLSGVAWRRDVRDVRGRVRILDGPRVVLEGWLEVNGALSYRGVTFFLTSWGADEFGSKFLGVQYRRDPAAPVFWAGAIVLALALPPFVLLRRSRVAGADRDGRAAG